MAKKNVGGRLMAVTYGLSTSFNVDPMEKKPLYHFHPGSQILSIGPNACNLGCQFCQNFQISQQAAPTTYLPPADVAKAALKISGCAGVAYTYTEPLMWYEYILDAAEAVKKAGLKNVLVTNGYLEPEPYDAILPLIDALNVDIKSMDEEFYRKICKGKLAPVLRNVEKTAGRAHIEITNLVIPGLNDKDDNFERLAKYLAGIDPFIPLHFSRYFPMYKMKNPATPPDTLFRAADIAKQWLKYVFVGNIYAGGYDDTHCPECNALLVRRDGYEVNAEGLKDGKCASCGANPRIVT
jgi:pyruvate formate lyase activating enzyme